MKKLHLLLITLTFLSCSNEERVQSTEYDDTPERIENAHLVAYSTIHDAEYDLYTTNTFFNEYNFTYAVKVDPTQIHKWTTGIQLEKSAETNPDISWTQEVVAHRKQNWKTTSAPQFYSKGPMVSAVIYEPEGIIFLKTEAD